MGRTTLRSRSLSLLAAAALLAGTSSCVFRIGGWGDSSDVFGHSVSSDDGVLTVDGTPLPFDRWVEVSLDLASVPQLELGTATDVIRIQGVAGTTATLKARLYSEIEGDGAALIESGRLVARSQGGGKVFINAIDGSVPAAIGLKLTSGTGAIDVSALAGTAPVSVDDGTGNATLRGSATGELKVSMGTGDLRVEDGEAPSLTVETGTGDVHLVRLKSSQSSIESGTGAVSLTGCELGTVRFESGTGSMRIDGGRLGTVRFESGTGGLHVESGDLESVRFESGTGDITQSKGAMIGSISGG
jgi:hypothetical protein